MTTLREILSDEKLNSIICLLKKAESERTEEENRSIVDFLGKIPYFKSLSEDYEDPQQFLVDFSKLFQYEMYNKGQAIGHHEEMCEKFWIILQGDVKTYIPKPFSSSLFDVNLINSKPGDDFKGSLSNLEASLTRSKSKHSEMIPASLNLQASLQRVPETSSIDLDDKKSSGKSNPTTDVILEVDESSQAEERSPSLRRVHSRKNRARATMISAIVMPNYEEIEIFKKFENMQEKYFAFDESLKFESDRNFRSGSCFSDLKTNPCMPLPCTVVCWEDTHMLSIPMKTFVQEMKLRNRGLADNLFLLDQIFEGMQERTLITLAFAMERRVFRRGEILYEEDNECKYLYIIDRGDVELLKNVALKVNQGNPVDSHSKPKERNKRTPALVLSEHQIFGEELFINYETYCFTARVKSSEVVIHMIPKEFLISMRPFHQAFHELSIEIANSSLNSKRARVFKTINGAQMAFDILDVPTAQERIQRAQTKLALDYFTHTSLNEQESGTGSASSPHFRVGPEVSKQMHETSIRELQHLATTKARVIRESIKYEIKFDLEGSSPLRQRKKDHEDRNFTELLEAHAKKPNFSNIEHGTPLSVWNIALKESAYSKRVKALKHGFMKKQIKKSNNSPQSARCFGYENDPFTSSNLKVQTMIEDQLKEKENEIKKTLVHRLQMKPIEEVEMKFPPIKVESLPTEVFEGNRPFSRSVSTESVERTLRKEINNMLSVKMAHNKELESRKVKHNRLKKGFTLVLPERARESRGSLKNIQHQNMQPYSHRILTEPERHRGGIETIKLKDLFEDKKETQMTVERWKGGRRTSRSRLSNGNNNIKKMYLTELGLEDVNTILSTRRSRVSISTGRSQMSRDGSPIHTSMNEVLKYEDHKDRIRFPSLRTESRLGAGRGGKSNNDILKVFDSMDRKDSYGSLRSFQMTNYSQKYF